ncbi:putative polyketide synthase [Nemania abortiva]|nr:putative polyketide synthase [Nemania abortiva]
MVNSASVMRDDPVCIVGMGCHLPGAIKSPCELWDFLARKQCAQADVPSERFNIDGFYQQHGKGPGVINSRGGYFLEEDVRQFDNSFFNINNVEATYLEPQQRKLLEVVFECLENSGTTLEQISGSNTGVYVGNFTQDSLLMQFHDVDQIHRYHGTGTGLTLLANRVSHVFNLHGPSVTLDTACSSSMHSLHLAVAAIKAGECDSAIVGGANLILTPQFHIAVSKTGVLSPTSTCHTFDAAADGYGRAEGINAIYVKRLSHAVRDGDTIFAVVRGSALNSNGRTPGVTLPSVEFQEAVIRKAYSSASLDFADTDYVECHGTGTAVGDPIEIEALARCFSRDANHPLMIGAVKPNVGHSEAASALTSIIKVALSLHRGFLLPTLDVKEFNPKFNLPSLNFQVVTTIQRWPRSHRRASVSSFGYGGANSHLILESYDSYMGGKSREDVSCWKIQPNSFVLPVSAASGVSLETRKESILSVISQSNADQCGTLVYTLAQRRSFLESRAFSIISHEEGSAKFKPSDWTTRKSETPLPIAFVFNGQGSQYARMGKELFESNSVFQNTIRQMDQVIQKLPSPLAPGWTLEETILGAPDRSQINHVSRSQPLCTALQIALVNMLRSWGIKPSVVIGHSSGEIAAAYAAGHHTATQAMLAAYFRGYCAAKVTTRGAMLALGVSSIEAKALLDKLGLINSLTIACVNSPQSVTISGPQENVHSLFKECQKQQIFSRLLETGGRAYHSQDMLEIGALYEQLIAPYVDNNVESEKRASLIEMYSTVGCSDDETCEIRSGMKWSRYWRSNIEQPVQFSSTVSRHILSREFHIIEIGPHSALKGPIKHIQAVTRGRDQLLPYTPTLIKNENGDVCMKRLAGTLFLYGHQLNWQDINDLPHHLRKPMADLSNYPWDYSRGLLWFEPRTSINMRNRVYPRHELLGSRNIVTNEIDWTWKNTLNLEEVPWLRDHKVGRQVIFPAAGYLAMAVEALSQIRGLKRRAGLNDMAFKFQNVSINAALIVSDGAELHTTMSLRRLSTRSSSTKLYDFGISSWAAAGRSTLHCSGAVKIVDVVDALSKKDSTISDETIAYRSWAPGLWYDKLTEHGMGYGPQFQCLTKIFTDNDRQRSDVKVTMSIPAPFTSGSYYPVHPISLDGCLQSGTISATFGSPRALRCYLPVFITECQVQAVNLGYEDRCGYVHSRSQKTGFSTMRMNCTLRGSQDNIIVDMKGIRFKVYTGADFDEVKQELQSQRHPTLRVDWKPEITRLNPAIETQLDDYITIAIRHRHPSPLTGDNEPHSIVGAILDLAGHQNPRMRVLELGDENAGRTQSFLAILDHKTAFPRFGSWTTSTVELNGSFEANESPYDVLLHWYPESGCNRGNSQRQLASFVGERGIIIAPQSTTVRANLEADGFTVIVVKHQILLAIRSTERPALQGKHIVILTPRDHSNIDQFAMSLAAYLQLNHVSSIIDRLMLDKLDKVMIPEQAIVISLLEAGEEFLTTMTQESMDKLRLLVSRASDVIWVTCANQLGNIKPNNMLVSGFSRAITLERPSLRFVVMDIGSSDELSVETTGICQQIGAVLVPGFTDKQQMDEREFVLFNGLLYISRFGPDFELNTLFQHRLKTQSAASKNTLANTSKAVLSIGLPGVADTLYFRQICEPMTEPPAGFIDVAVKAVGLNAKDVYVMSGRVEVQTGTSANEFTGVITAVAPDVKQFEVGDRVLVCAPNSFSTIERVPGRAAVKILSGENYTTMASLPVAYCAALYALRERSSLRAGETILVHSGAGAFGMAVISIAQNIGATVYTTVGSDKKRDFLVSRFGLPPAHIFQSRNDSFVADLKRETNGRGVDVVINSLVGDLMHSSWECVADFGRFVEVGKKELVDAGNLQMHIFLRNVTFTAFDLADLFFSNEPYHHETSRRLLKDVMAMYRSGRITTAPITVFGAEDISKAYRYFSIQDRIGKIVISFEDSQALIPFSPSTYRTILDPGKTYFLVGCLGGLGRSLSRWMLRRGARKFVFLGRSGLAKEAGQELVASLQRAGAHVTVIRGDVCKAADVQEAVKVCMSQGGRIGGVVQAAMALHEALFENMSSAQWHTVVRPKWAGTWNIHNALQGNEHGLDFFLMTSSMNGAIGVATESNYCAANAFLDAFAQWRRNQGKVAVSVGLGMISEVGYLHENPNIEALLLRRGVQPLNEDELLQVIDLAISGTGSYSSPPHILTGMETLEARKLFSRGFQMTHAIMDDQRSAILAAALENAGDPHEGATKRMRNSGVNVTIPEWLEVMPHHIQDSLIAEAGADSLRDAIRRTIGSRFSSLILLQENQINHQKPFADYGVDSMIASEFRTWCWNTFKVDIPLLDLISTQKSLDTVTELVEATLTDAQRKL